MKGSGKKVSFSSPPIKSPASPKGSDENHRSNQQKTQAVKKNFMSPTVCAAASKKILGERNENLDSNPSSKLVSHKNSSPNLEPFSQKSSPLSSSPNPYDPLKNYLSPRPQFLRYNPDRRKEIVLRLEMEDKEGDDDDTVSSENSSLDSSQESGDESESLFDEEESDSESEEEVELEVEEEETELTWSFREVLKYLLLSVVLVLSTSYISSMNAPVASPPVFEATLGFQNQSFGIVEGFDVVGYKFLDLDDEVIEEFDSIVEDEFEEELIMMDEEPEEFAENIELHEIQDVIEDQTSEETGEEIEFLQVDHQASLLSERTDSSEESEEQEIQDVIEDQTSEETGEEIEFLQVDHQASLLSERTDSSEESEDFHKEILQVAVNMLENWGKSIALKFQELNLDMGTCVAIVVFGTLTFASIVTSFLFRSNISRNGNAPKQSSPADDKRSTKPVLKSSSSSPLPAEKLVPLFTTTSKVPVGSQAPSVELLAEFDVGGISRPVKSAPLLNRTSSSSYSYFSEQGFSQLSAGNYSNSPARSSAKKNQPRRSNDLPGERGNNEVMTPLRRSTRIRKRVDIASP